MKNIIKPNVPADTGKVDLSSMLDLVGTKLVVEVVEVVMVSSSGLDIGRSSAIKRTIGEVMLVSEKLKNDYAVGDMVCYPEFGGVEMFIDEKPYLILDEPELFFKYNGEVIEAVNNYLIIKQNDRITNTSGGVTFSKGSEKERTSGIVISSSKHNDPKLKTGAEVVFSKYSGFESSIKDKTYLVLVQEEILIILKQK